MTRLIEPAWKGIVSARPTRVRTPAGAIFPSETLGDYLLFALPPERAPMLYTHVHLFSPEYWQLCLVVKRGEPGWDAILDAYGVGLVVVEAELHPRLGDQLHRSSKWQVLVDETGDNRKPDVKARLLVAVRRH